MLKEVEDRLVENRGSGSRYFARPQAGSDRRADAASGRMPLAVKPDSLSNPIEVGLVGAIAIMACADGVSHLFEQLWHGEVSWETADQELLLRRAARYLSHANRVSTRRVEVS